MMHTICVNECNINRVYYVISIFEIPMKNITENILILLLHIFLLSIFILKQARTLTHIPKIEAILRFSFPLGLNTSLSASNPEKFSSPRAMRGIMPPKM